MFEIIWHLLKVLYSQKDVCSTHNFTLITASVELFSFFVHSQWPDCNQVHLGHEGGMGSQTPICPNFKTDLKTKGDL